MYFEQICLTRKLLYNPRHVLSQGPSKMAILKDSGNGLISRQYHIVNQMGGYLQENYPSRYVFLFLDLTLCWKMDDWCCGCPAGTNELTQVEAVTRVMSHSGFHLLVLLFKNLVRSRPICDVNGFWPLSLYCLYGCLIKVICALNAIDFHVSYI